MVDLDELRNQTYRYADNVGARIPCPDCHHRGELASVLCDLCDGEGCITKARALAVLPHVVAHVRELRKSTCPKL